VDWVAGWQLHRDWPKGLDIACEPRVPVDLVEFPEVTMDNVPKVLTKESDVLSDVRDALFRQGERTVDQGRLPIR
jgi:hypothetical protein